MLPRERVRENGAQYSACVEENFQLHFSLGAINTSKPSAPCSIVISVRKEREKSLWCNCKLYVKNYCPWVHEIRP